MIMRTLFFFLVVLFALDLLTQSPGPILVEEAESPGALRFVAVDVFLDTGEQPLAAYQLELSGDSKALKIVGIEGGEHSEFRNPPFYDPNGIQHERLIVAAFSAAEAAQLPRGRSRILTVHLQLSGTAPLKIESTLTIAANADGQKIPAQLTISERTQE
jgi:hypothetical protein